MPTTYMNPRHFWKRFLPCSYKIITKRSLALAVSISIFVVTILDQLTVGKDDFHRNGNIDVPRHEGYQGMQKNLVNVKPSVQGC